MANLDVETSASGTAGHMNGTSILRNSLHPFEIDIDPSDYPTKQAEGDVSYVETVTNNQFQPFVTDEERDTASDLQVDHSRDDKSGKYSTFTWIKYLPHLRNVLELAAEAPGPIDGDLQALDSEASNPDHSEKVVRQSAETGGEVLGRNANLSLYITGKGHRPIEVRHFQQRYL